MIKINDNSAKIILKEKFYPEKNVLQAIEDFKDVCEIEKIGEEIILRCGDVEKVSYEFCNYVLGLINNEKSDVK